MAKGFSTLIRFNSYERGAAHKGDQLHERFTQQIGLISIKGVADEFEIPQLHN
jgi:hypothetical protein